MNREKAPDNTGLPRLKIQYLIATTATLFACVLFVWTGGSALPGLLSHPSPAAGEDVLGVAVILNIALILLGWRRSKELYSAVEGRMRAEQDLIASARSDDVTGLLNRRALNALIDDIPVGDRGGALLLLDLDNFKSVNDLYGHAAGDQLLRIASERLQGAVPASAACARIGGDEFAVFLPSRSAAASGEHVAGRILESLSAPIVLDQTEVAISASIGIATLDEICVTADALFQRSDIAMYEAKRAGKNRCTWFDWQMEDDLHRRHQLEAEIRAGIANGEFVPFFQPLIDLQSSALTGFEALARWQHPHRGLLEPCEFIHTAEASGLISALSLSVMRQALQQAKGWPGHLKVAINVSPVQFKDPALAQKIMQVLTAVGFPPARLEVEITENSLLHDQGLALATATSLKNLGISLSLDDFGTGYASLAQLKALPFDRIKIDRSLVSPVLDDAQSNAIVATIANLGHSLDLPVTAEGVESVATKERLASIGCDDAQGWLFGRAVPAETINAVLGTSSIGAPHTGPAADFPDASFRNGSTATHGLISIVMVSGGR